MQVYRTRTTLPHEIDTALLKLSLYTASTTAHDTFEELFGGNIIVCDKEEVPESNGDFYDLDEIVGDMHIYGVVMSDAGGDIYVVRS